MAFTESRIFRATITDNFSLSTTTKMNLSTDSFKVALYGNTGTPDRNVTNANSAYAVAQWVVGNEVISSTGGWPAGGIALASPSLNSATANTVFFTGSNTASTTSTATIAAAFGCLVYDTTSTSTTNQGVCYNYFGGTQIVTNGLMTIAWPASPTGIMNIVV